MEVDKNILRARVLLSRVVTVAGVVAILAAVVKGAMALEELTRASNDKSAPPQPDDSQAQGTVERDADAMASVITTVFESAKTMDRQRQHDLIALVAEGLSKLPVPLAQRVIEILVETAGQSPEGATLTMMLLRKMWYSEASGKFFSAVQSSLTQLRRLIPTNHAEFKELVTNFSDSASSTLQSAQGTFESVVGGVYDYGTAALERIQARFGMRSSDTPEPTAEPQEV